MRARCVWPRGPFRLQSGCVVASPADHSKEWVKPMLSFAHTPTTRLMAYMAAVLSAAATLHRLARPDSSTGAHTLRRGRGVQFIFRPLADEPAVRATKPEPDWLQVAAHYRPVP